MSDFMTRFIARTIGATILLSSVLVAFVAFMTLAESWGMDGLWAMCFGVFGGSMAWSLLSSFAPSKTFKS